MKKLLVALLMSLVFFTPTASLYTPVLQPPKAEAFSILGFDFGDLFDIGLNLAITYFTGGALGPGSIAGGILESVGLGAVGDIFGGIVEGDGLDNILGGVFEGQLSGIIEGITGGDMLGVIDDILSGVGGAGGYGDLFLTGLTSSGLFDETLEPIFGQGMGDLFDRVIRDSLGGGIFADAVEDLLGGGGFDDIIVDLVGEGGFTDLFERISSGEGISDMLGDLFKGVEEQSPGILTSVLSSYGLSVPEDTSEDAAADYFTNLVCQGQFSNLCSDDDLAGGGGSDLLFGSPGTDTLANPPNCERGDNGACGRVQTGLPWYEDGQQTWLTLSAYPSELITRIMTYVLGLVGGIAIILFILAGYKILMSNGKPEDIQQGKEQLVSAIVGMIFVIFSFVIFQLIVVDILRIPGICTDPNDPACQQQNAPIPELKPELNPSDADIPPEPDGMRCNLNSSGARRICTSEDRNSQQICDFENNNWTCRLTTRTEFRTNTGVSPDDPPGMTCRWADQQQNVRECTGEDDELSQTCRRTDVDGQGQTWICETSSGGGKVEQESPDDEVSQSEDECPPGQHIFEYRLAGQVLWTTCRDN